MLRYKCLVLDHDDTVVESTPNVHYPSFCRTLERLRPGRTMTLDDYIKYNTDPGFDRMCFELLGFSEEEMAIQESEWLEGLKTNIPPACEGMERVILRQKEEGGLVCVASHSRSEYIRRDYKELFGTEPDLVFGWDNGEGRRKPDPYPLLEIMKALSLHPSDLLMVDDLRPGCDMAHFCGVDFAYAGWSATARYVREQMLRCSDYVFNTTGELERFLFGSDARMSWHRRKYL